MDTATYMPVCYFEVAVGEVAHVVGYHTRGLFMAMAVKKAISLPLTVSKELEAIAREEGKTISAIIQEALRLAKRERVKKDVRVIQGYWSRKAEEQGILTERGLKKYLAKKVRCGRVVMKQATLDIEELQGLLHRPGIKSVSIAEMNRIIRRRGTGRK